jgi:hypothetical protein
VIRETSLEALRHITETGILGRARTRVYEVLYRYGPLAEFEVADYSDVTGYGSTLAKRVSELYEMGLVKVAGETKHPRTGRRCIQWDVTTEIPREPYRPKLSLRKQLAKVEEEVHQLREQVAELWKDSQRSLF